MASLSHEAPEEAPVSFETVRCGHKLSEIINDEAVSTASPHSSSDDELSDDGTEDDPLRILDDAVMDSLVDVDGVDHADDVNSRQKQTKKNVGEMLTKIGKVLLHSTPFLIAAGIVIITGLLALNPDKEQVSQNEAWIGTVAGELTVDAEVERLLGSSSGSSSSNATDSSGSSGGGHHSSAFAPIAFLLLCFTSSALCKWLVQRLPKAVQLPHSVVLFVFGTLIASLATAPVFDTTELADVIRNFSAVDPHVIFWLLLPALLYEDSCQVKWHVTKRVLPSALLLALPGVMLNTVLTAAMMVPLGWDFQMALLLGSICSATDPVAVMAALHQLHAPEKLSELIAAESLLNDGSAVVLFQVFLKAVNGEHKFEIGYAAKFFMQLSFCGPLVGVGFGIVMFLWLKTTKDFHLESLVQVVAVFGAFFVSEHPSIHVSGVLAVVVLGFFMSVIGRFSLERANEHKHHVVIGYCSLLSHEAIFVIGGVVAYNFLVVNPEITARDWGELFYLYVLIHITRGTVVAFFYPILCRRGYGFIWKEAALCVYGGLRGAVGLAMALLVHADMGVPSKPRAQIAFHVSGIAMLTLALNGTTWPLLYRKLKVYPHRSLHAALMQRATCQMDVAADNHVMLLKSHWFFSNCQFDKISDLVPKVADKKGIRRAKTAGGGGFTGSLKDRVGQTMQRIGWNTARLESLRESKQGPPRLQATDDILTAIHGNLFCSAAHVATGAEDPNHVKAFDANELNEAENEEEQAAETYQTIVNAAMAIYNEMFEVRTIREKPFINLKQSIAFAEEAIHGELKNHSFIAKDPELRGLHEKDEASQMEKAILVSWRYLLFKCTVKEGTFWTPFDLADRHLNLWRLRVKIEWKSMAKHVETLLVFIMAHEQLLTEMHILKEMPAWGKLAETITRAKVEFLELFFGPGCSSREFEMFTCVQHILAARSTLVKKVLVIFDHVRMGLLSGDAAKAIISKEVRPLMHELRAFVPGWRHIKVFVGQTGQRKPQQQEKDRPQVSENRADRFERAVRRSSMLSVDHVEQTKTAARRASLVMMGEEPQSPKAKKEGKRNVGFNDQVPASSSGSKAAQMKGAIEKNVSEEEDWDCSTEDAQPGARPPASPRPDEPEHDQMQSEGSTLPGGKAAGKKKPKKKAAPKSLGRGQTQNLADPVPASKGGGEPSSKARPSIAPKAGEKRGSLTSNDQEKSPPK